MRKWFVGTRTAELSQSSLRNYQRLQTVIRLNKLMSELSELILGKEINSGGSVVVDIFNLFMNTEERQKKVRWG